jgi:hypothetical protein
LTSSWGFTSKRDPSFIGLYQHLLLETFVKSDAAFCFQTALINEASSIRPGESTKGRKIGVFFLNCKDARFFVSVAVESQQEAAGFS